MKLSDIAQRKDGIYAALDSNVSEPAHPVLTPHVIDLERLCDPFHSADLEWRIQSVTTNNKKQIKAIIVPYVTARAIYERLNDVCGAENWCNKEYTQGPQGGMQSAIGIRLFRGWDQFGVPVYEWVFKYDGAANPPDRSRKEDDDRNMGEMVVKGGFSNTDKRVGVKWGIGIDLYSLPAMRAIVMDRDDGFAPYWFSGNARNTDTQQKDRISFGWRPPHGEEMPRWYMDRVKETEAKRAEIRGFSAPEHVEEEAEGDVEEGDKDRDVAVAATENISESERAAADQTGSVSKLRKQLLGEIETLATLDYSKMTDKQKNAYNAAVDLADDMGAEEAQLMEAIVWAKGLIARHGAKLATDRTPDAVKRQKATR